MTATTPEAIRRKEDNRKSKKDMLREKKIYELGGKIIIVTYGFPLSPKQRQERIDYLYDLLYPKRLQPRLPKTRGRPRKYATKEEYREALRNKAREAYRRSREPSVTGNGWSSRTPWYTLYMGAKNRAKVKNIPFNITPEYLASIWTDICPVLGIEMKTNNNIMQDNSYSLDRFIPELGYTIGNVSIISQKANRIKTNATTEEVWKVLKWMRHSMP